ncbi:hypothetical protein PMEGAPR236_35060 [Priestia megaterium]
MEEIRGQINFNLIEALHSDKQPLVSYKWLFYLILSNIMFNNFIEFFYFFSNTNGWSPRIDKVYSFLDRM